jgi:hypothetical protein
MAIVGGSTRQSLDQHARCDGTPYCMWVPLGIAVLTQLSVFVDGKEVWVPVGTSVSGAVRTREPPAHLRVLRAWRGKPAPVEGSINELWNLVLLGGETISTTAPTHR